jgi:hypothetical protein
MRAGSGAARVVSVCAGGERDLLDVLERDRSPVEVCGRLVELDPTLVARTRERIAKAGLDQLEVVCGDAGIGDAYAGAVPADLVLLCGVFGNIADSDIRHTIVALPQLCAYGARIVWTRHRNVDITRQIRDWLSDAGFEERSFESPGPRSWSVGVHEFGGRPMPLEAGNRLFTFVR